MNPRFIEVLFVIIDMLHDANLIEWLDFVNGNLQYFINDFDADDKLELAQALLKLNVPMRTHQWYRRFGIVAKLHELI